MNKKQNTVIVGMVGNFLLAVAKSALSLISGSTALFADALHSFSDLLVSLMVIGGMKLNRKKIEAAITLFVGLLIISVAIVFVLELLFKEHPPMDNIMWTVCGQVAIIMGTYILYRYKNDIGVEEKSESLIADGSHTKSDMFSSIGVLISLTGSLIGLNLDKIAAFIIFFIILSQGMETILSGLYLFRGKEKFHLNIKFILDKSYLIVKKKKKALIIYSLILLLFIYIIPGFYIVKQNQSGIRTLLGVTDSEILTPGLHFNPLHPVSSVEFISTSEIHNMELGFSIEFSETDDILIHQMETIHNSKAFSVHFNEEEVITGDGSIVNVYTIVEYRISDPFSYVSYTENPVELLRIESVTQLQKVLGALSLFQILNSKRPDIERELPKRINKSMDFLNTGIFVENIILYSVNPHIETVYMYRNVQDEEQYKKTLVYDALAIKSRQIPYYRGLAYEKVINAEAKAQEIILKAERDSAHYKLLEREYVLNTKAVQFRLGLDSRMKVLKDSNKILIDNRLKENMIRLNSESGGE